MKIVADENIAAVEEYFGDIGELVLAPGRQIDSELLRDADVLLVRSVTRVDERLLGGSSCRFVGTATSGIDHMDTDFLTKAGIGFSAARGCNAEAVCDYVFSALAALSCQQGTHWTARSIGIVGCGEVGSRLAARCINLDMELAIHDPLLAPDHPMGALLDNYEKVLASDIVTFHTPLTKKGAFPTYHMLGARELLLLGRQATLINAARGAVVDNAALLNWLKLNEDATVVLDVWEGEPAILPGLLEQVSLGTPHIAGYSLEGRLNGTRMIHQALCRYLHIPCKLINPCSDDLPPIPGAGSLDDLILSACDIRRDDAALRMTASGPQPEVAFDQLRKNYPPRREFSACNIAIGELDNLIRKQAQALGFRFSFPGTHPENVPAGA